jgi:AraC-like DNA-binding protein
MLARVFRFQHVLQHIRPAEEMNWIDIALAWHYHDQSHFNKEFAAFTGLTPSDYIDLRAKYHADFGKNENGHFVPIG